MRKTLFYFLIFALMCFNISVYAAETNSGESGSTSFNTSQTEENTGKNENENYEENKEPSDEEEGAAREYEWKADLSTIGGNFANVQSYTVEESEKDLMYDAETVLRRDNASGEAWIVYEIPYVEQIYAVSYHLASDVAHFSFEASKDGEAWTTLEVATDETVTADRWTRVEFSVKALENLRYIKVVWGIEKNTANWWNPYFGGLFANVGEPVPSEIVILSDSTLCIPMYDTKTYALQAEILDQIGLNYDAEISWEIISENADEFEITKNGEVTIKSDMSDGEEFTVCASALDGVLKCEKTFSLAATMPGDVDGDNAITDIDIAEICASYGMSVNGDNRLCDIDKNGVIDIIDLTYAVKYMVNN